MIIERETIKGTIALRNKSNDYVAGCPADGVVLVFTAEKDRLAEYKELGFEPIKTMFDSIESDTIDIEKLNIALKKANIEVSDDITLKVKAYLDNYLEDDIEIEKKDVEAEKPNMSGFYEKYPPDEMINLIMQGLKTSKDEGVQKMIEERNSAYNI